MKILWVGMLFLIGHLGLAQLPSTSLSYGIGLQRGHVFPTNDFLKGTNHDGGPISHFKSLAFSFRKTLAGPEPWHHLYKHPQVGLGIQWFSFDGAEDHLGEPIALFALFHAPYVREEISH